MASFFALVFLATLVAIPYWGIALAKQKLEEKNRKGIKGLKEKIKSFIKKEPAEQKKSKYTAEQLKTFLISSIIICIISLVGIGVTAPPVEPEIETNNTGNESVTNITENTATEDSQEETSEEATSKEAADDEQHSEEQNNNTSNDETEQSSENKNVSSNNNTSSLNKTSSKQELEGNKATSVSNVPAYSGSPYIAINNNVPFFANSELTTNSYENYSSLDSLGRCRVATACIGRDIMPTSERGSIGSVKPSGWHSVRYQGIDGNYLYNRCHLIGFQLSGENANNRNLITGTRYLNINGMLPFENMVADYVKETNNHVLYRVTPIFKGNNLLASGVLMEGYSVEDNGAGIQFCVYCYNVQPGITIDYSTGASSGPEYTGSSNNSSDSSSSTNPAPAPKEEPKQETSNSQTYILNTNTKKFHYSSCGSARKISEKNKGTFTGSRDELISQGYSPCGNCDP